ncbi:MAG TPA: hypothetical protein VGK94_14445 [Candidatus Polarisedimenticolia bacterium]|jgi:hypothetical protein
MIDARFVLQGLGLLCVVAGGASPAIAEPYLAVRTGLQCPACHVNHTGGGKRTPFGADHGLEKLPGHRLPLPEGTQPFNGTVSRLFSVGADFRGLNASRFARTEVSNTFATGEANLYADLELLRDHLRLYADVKVAPGGVSTREIVGLVENLPGRLYVKAGRFFAPFGWRLLDDGAFIRARTGYTFAAPDDGVEIGWQPGWFQGSLAVTNGNGGSADDNTNKRVSLISTWAHPRVRIGSSAAVNRQGDVGSILGGLMGGVKVSERVVALGEVDFGRDDDKAAGTVRRQVIAFGEIDVLAGRGVNLKAAFDYNDPDRADSGDEVNRVTVGVEWFAVQYTQFRLLWRRTDRPPEVRGAVFEDDRELVIEGHLFF